MKLGMLFTLWLAAAIAGFGYTMVWAFSPGESARASRPEGAHAGVQVQAIIHPLCPCSGATLDLVRQAIATSASRPSVEVIFCGDPQDSKNVRLAKSIPKAKIQFLNEAEMLKRFGSATSGQLFVWNQGKLAFSGGITEARGESAKGAAYDQFQQALNEGLLTAVDMPIYGCPVQGDR